MRQKISILRAAMPLSVALMLFLPACHTVDQIRPPTAFVSIVKVIVDDSPGGNKDGQVDPGETVKIQLQLKNVGKTQMPASQASVFTSQSGILISQKVLDFPAVAAGDSAFSRGSFVLSADSNLSAPSVAFSIEATAGANYQATFPVEISAPLFPVAVAKIVIDDSQGGNNDRRANPGETINLRLQLTNTTTEQKAIPPSQARLFSSEAGIKILIAVVNFPRIAPGRTVESNAAYSVAIDTNFAGSSAAFCLEGTFSPQAYQASFCFPIFSDLYACIEKCEIIPATTTPPQPQRLRIFLRLCNGRTTVIASTAQQVALYIRPTVESSEGIQTCDHSVTFVTATNATGAMMDKVYYSDISLSECKDPQPQAAISPVFFEYTVASGTLAAGSCIYFQVEIYTGASTDPITGGVRLSSASSPSIPATLIKSMELGYKL